MRTKTVGYGVVLSLTIASIALALSVSSLDATRFVVLQAATLVAAVRTADVRGGTRLAALVAILVVVAAAIGWAISSDVRRRLRRSSTGCWSA